MNAGLYRRSAGLPYGIISPVGSFVRLAGCATGTVCGFGRSRTACVGRSVGREQLATHHRVLDVRDAGCLDRPDLFELDLGGPEVVEEASAAPEEHRNDVQLELVQESRREVWADDFGAAPEHDGGFVGALLC